MQETVGKANKQKASAGNCKSSDTAAARGCREGRVRGDLAREAGKSSVQGAGQVSLK